MRRIKITTFVPLQNAEAVREALGKAGAGTIGQYSYCSYSTTGKGRFTPSADARPHIGRPNKLETVEEERIEVVCDRNKAKDVIHALRQAHPYEEPAFDIVALLEEEDL